MAFVKTDGKQLGNLGGQRVWTEEIRVWKALERRG